MASVKSANKTKRENPSLLLKEYKDGNDGRLIIAEANRDIPFDIKRVYFITDFGNKKALRGMHAHRKLKQVIYCLRGSFLLGMYDGKKFSETYMKKPNQGAYIAPLIWHSMRQFTKDCLICVFASDHYKEKDYIRDFVDFKRLAK